MSDVDRDNPPLVEGVGRRDLAMAAWRYSVGLGAWQREPIHRERFGAWWDAEQYAIVKRASLCELAQAAYNAAKPRGVEYEPGDGFGAWWTRLCDEARLAMQGVATA